jgi:hypothetical protein
MADEMVITLERKPGRPRKPLSNKPTKLKIAENETETAQSAPDASKPLRPKYERFAMEYAGYGEKSSAGNAAASARAVGAKDHLSIGYGYKMMLKSGVKARVEYLQRMRVSTVLSSSLITVEDIRREHSRLAAKCEELGLMGEVRENVKLLGQTIAAYSDGVTINLSDQAQYDERVALEAQRLARLRLPGCAPMLEAPATVILPANQVQSELIGIDHANPLSMQGQSLEGNGAGLHPVCCLSTPSDQVHNVAGMEGSIPPDRPGSSDVLIAPELNPVSSSHIPPAICSEDTGNG